MNRKKLIKKYIEFFESMGHKEIANSSLIPENDPTVLFTTAGMHPIVPYLLGQSHPLGKRLCNIQRCIRTQDIEKVGDTYHHTFFEMLGNWSFGDYFKKEAIEMSFEFLTKTLKIPINRLGVTIFGGDKNFPKIPKDDESAKIWKSLGIPDERIVYMHGGVENSKDNWWGPAGQTGPCGPSTEMFYWKSNDIASPKKFDPKDERWVEIWNDVLMQYVKESDGNYKLAEQKNIDTGMGIERTVTILNSLEDNYLSDSFNPIIKKIEKLSGKKYGKNEQITRAMRIITDHLKASTFIIGDGVVPSNTERGYVLRRLIRRSIRYGKVLEIKNFASKVIEPIFKIYEDYPTILKNKEKIIKELNKEEERFNQTLEKGISKFNKIIRDKKEINGEDAFLLYQSFGFPIEMIKELAEEKRIKIDEKSFKKELKKHQELSRTASVGKFKSGLADESIATTRLHTATHLLNAALRTILKDKTIEQKGSNINPERLRFDFNFPRKLTKEEIQKIEDLVNFQIKRGCKITREETTLEKAKKSGAVGVFENKYMGKVSIYTIEGFSKEICTGPHIKNTSELGHFKIKKEESSSAGIRRIRAVLE